MGLVLAAARAELHQIIRRDLTPNLEADSVEDLGEFIVSRGGGVPAREVAVALRTSEWIIRRACLAAGLDAERGRPLELNGDGSQLDRGLELLRAGLSVRAASMLSGVPRSTLHDRARGAVHLRTRAVGSGEESGRWPTPRD